MDSRNILFCAHSKNTHVTMCVIKLHTNTEQIQKLMAKEMRLIWVTKESIQSEKAKSEQTAEACWCHRLVMID